MPICKGKTKLGKRCKVKSNNKYCKRHIKKGGVNTDIDHLDRHISKFLDLGTLGKMQQLSKQHKKTVKEEQKKRRFDNWQLLQNFNQRQLSRKDIAIFGKNYENLHKNKDFLNLINKKPITPITIKNLLNMTSGINTVKLRTEHSILVGKVSLIYSKNLDRKPYVFIKANINKYTEFIVNFRLDNKFLEYIPKFKYLINENLKLL